MSYKLGLFLVNKQTLTQNTLSLFRSLQYHPDVKATLRSILNTTKNSRQPGTKVRPFLIPKCPSYMALYLDLYSSCCFFDPSSTFRKATDSFQNPLKQVYLDLPCWPLIELGGTSILNRIQKGKHKGLGFPRIIFRTQETCCV